MISINKIIDSIKERKFIIIGFIVGIGIAYGLNSIGTLTTMVIETPDSMLRQGEMGLAMVMCGILLILPVMGWLVAVKLDKAKLL